MGEILPNLKLQNIILTYTKDFSWKKWTKFDKTMTSFFFQITGFL
jgi:hypothetical protein